AGVLAVALLATSALTPVMAQTTGGNAADTTVATDDDDGFDWGLLGLLGLLGLIPRKRSVDVHPDTSRPRT
ncbi:MAG TPA: WGxxGxxG family protein, partial [Lysobacter sp.]|nr:WGxxGxxG family protein [Lysobacter sp.]